ncbi:hypothetical protein D3C76_1653960 [compost metagenome]
MHRAKPGARWPARAKLNTQHNMAICSTGAKMIDNAMTRAMKVMLPWLRICTASHNVAEWVRPCMPMVITG